MTPIQEYVIALSHEERHDIIRSYEQFERDGHIGDEAVRIHASKFMACQGITDDNTITRWMNFLAFECYRYYYRVCFDK